MTRRQARWTRLAWGLALAALLVAGCGRRSSTIAINTPAPIQAPTALPVVERAPSPAALLEPTVPPGPTQPPAVTRTATPAATALPAATPTVRATQAPPGGSWPTTSPVAAAPGESVERTVVVGAAMVDCAGEGAGDGRCYLVKEEGDATWTVFPGQIEGFGYWPGAEYGIVVREEKLAPLPGGPEVTWTLLKGLFKRNP